MSCLPSARERLVRGIPVVVRISVVRIAVVPGAVALAVNVLYRSFHYNGFCRYSKTIGAESEGRHTHPVRTTTNS